MNDKTSPIETVKNALDFYGYTGYRITPFYGGYAKLDYKGLCVEIGKRITYIETTDSRRAKRELEQWLKSF